MKTVNLEDVVAYLGSIGYASIGNMVHEKFRDRYYGEGSFSYGNESRWTQETDCGGGKGSCGTVTCRTCGPIRQ